MKVQFFILNELNLEALAKFNRLLVLQSLLSIRTRTFQG